MNIHYTSIVTMIMKNENLQNVLNTAAEYLQAAIIITNDTLDIIAASTTLPIRDSYWVKALKDGYCSKEMLSKIYNDPFVKTLSEIAGINSGFSYPPDNVSMKYYIQLPLDTSRNKITILSFPLENKFEKKQQDFLLSFSFLLKNTYFCSDNKSLLQFYQTEADFLYSLLTTDSSIFSKEEIKSTNDNATISFENIQLLVFSPDFQNITDMLLHAYADNINKIFHNKYATIYNSSVVTFFYANELTCENIALLTQLAQQSNAKIGISWTFSGKDFVYWHYQQAAFTIKIARAMNLFDYLFTYDDVYIYEIVNHCCKQEHWIDKEHPILTTLRNYDNKHGSCLYDTLYILLKCGMNSALTAEKLNVHKSTLYHRTEILKELIPGLFKKNMYWQTSIMLAFDLARLQSKN